MKNLGKMKKKSLMWRVSVKKRKRKPASTVMAAAMADACFGAEVTWTILTKWKKVHTADTQTHHLSTYNTPTTPSKLQKQKKNELLTILNVKWRENEENLGERETRNSNICEELRQRYRSKSLKKKQRSKYMKYTLMKERIFIVLNWRCFLVWSEVYSFYNSYDWWIRIHNVTIYLYKQRKFAFIYV